MNCHCKLEENPVGNVEPMQLVALLVFDDLTLCVVLFLSPSCDAAFRGRHCSSSLKLIAVHDVNTARPLHTANAASRAVRVEIQ